MAHPKALAKSAPSLAAACLGFIMSTGLITAKAEVAQNPLREAYFGDLHLHTTYSFDSYVLFGATADPEVAYRFARGEPIEYLGETVRRREPLDFLAVTDHSENLGVFNQLIDPNSYVSKSEMGKALQEAMSVPGDPKARLKQLWPFFRTHAFEPLPPDLQAVSASAWQREIDFANRFNEPGKFTAFVAYEWSSSYNGANLHRNVIFRGNSAPYPFSSAQSLNPEDLWAWLDKIKAQGFEALAIPHNSNASFGLMFDWVTLDGRPLDRAYAEARQAHEPLVEISQNKGASETHPLLSSRDEFANYEILDRSLVSTKFSPPPGSYVRDALSRGLVLERKLGVNPFKYGMVGASDLHGTLQVSNQEDYAGNAGGANLGGGRPTKEQARAILTNNGDGAAVMDAQILTTAGNLTGAWAESNTRDSIYDALRRRETFATTGTRLRVRVFGGWTLAKNLFDHSDWVKTAYADGVPMGSDLPANATGAVSPRFAVWAAKDPNGANLDRIQIIKVWEEDGRQQEKVFDVAWSGHRMINRTTGKLPAVGNTVNLHTGAYTNSIGAAQLQAVWSDPEFNKARLAAYYVRALEIPTPRWSTLLAIKNQLPIPTTVPASEQQRAWSSPIWYTPAGM